MQLTSITAKKIKMEFFDSENNGTYSADFTLTKIREIDRKFLRSFGLEVLNTSKNVHAIVSAGRSPNKISVLITKVTMESSK